MIKRYCTIIFFFALVALIQSCDGLSESKGLDSLSGTGGSMARFTIVGDYLFTVDNSNLQTFDISSVEDPEYINDQVVGDGVETIFPLNDLLFLGTSSGMYIYDISNEGEATKLSFYQHVVACDPVVSDGEYAYVTLSSVRFSCWQSVDELQIIDLADIQNPLLVKKYQLQHPQGLAIKNDTLWVCDDGLKIFDVSDKKSLRKLYHFDDLEAYDVILDHDRALVIGETGFTQYKLENDTIRQLSEINIEL
ncbi:MAG: hypothetical protein JXR61_05820 [Prolixibacteraceae bacterium]|nr:hypothetical protein [Prolixibacteraceae bacterium]